ncbi:MAG: PAS domain-containing protein [Natronohydrobacter sp.]|nr:PAS domain-containing protein [Natronohydrobacter sp.]
MALIPQPALNPPLHRSEAPFRAAVAQAQTLLQRADVARLDDTIQTMLQMIGQAFPADRAYVFMLRDQIFVNNTHEWFADGVAPVQAENQKLNYSTGEFFWTAFKTQGFLHLTDTSALPLNSELRAIMTAQNVKSLIAVPFFHDADLAGFLGFDLCRQQRNFTLTETNALQGLAATLSLALKLRDTEQARLRLDADLRAANERVAAMIDSAPELLVETDRMGVIVAFHQSAPLTFALSPVEVIGHPPEACLPEAVAALCRKAMVQVNQRGWSDTFDYPLVIDGVTKRFSLHATARQNARTGARKGYIFVIRDITDSYLQAQHNRTLSRVAELSTNLIMLTDAERRITWINPAGVARTGFSLAHARGRRPSEILRLPDAAPDIVQTLCAQLRNGEDINEEVQALSKTDMPYWINLNVQKLQDADGVIQGLMLVASDVTAQKLAESRALRDRATAMDALREGIAIIQPDGRISYVNPVLRGALHLPDDMPTEALSWPEISPDLFNRQLVSLLPQLYEKGIWRGDITLPDPELGERHFDISLTLQADGGALFLSRDISDRKAAERNQALLREQLQLAQSRQLVAQLASGLAHDVANVLAVITHALNLLRPARSAKEASALSRIEAATTQAQALVGNLSRLGGRSTDAGQIDLRPLLEQAADLARPSLGTGTKLHLDLPQTPIEIHGDSTAVMQVFLNLILNARDALCRDADLPGRISLSLTKTRTGTSPPVAEIGQLRADRPYVLFEITDTGEGMDAARKSAMFDAYFSTKGANGIGLGLSIVAEILSAAAGAIRVSSQPGQGTTVQVYWPADPPTTPDAGHPAPESRDKPLSGRTILLVDDDDTVLQHLSHVLVRAGAEVASTTNPRDALAAFRAAPEDWDMVIIDHDMTPMTGLELARKFHQIDANLPIILATGAAALQSAPEYAQTDIAFRLRKPVCDNVLVAVILDILLRRAPFGHSAAYADATSDSG